MAEPDKQQIGDGSDNYSHASGQMAKAVKDQTAQRAVSDAAAASVKAGVESGKAVSEVAAGTAAAGPWGAVLSSAWSMRHSLFKVLICLVLGLVILVTVVTSTPKIIANSLFGLDGNKPAEGRSLQDIYDDLGEAVTAVIDEAYTRSLDRADKMITDSGLDYDESMDVMVNHAQGSAGYDVCYILCAYSVSVGENEVSREDMLEKLKGVSGEMFPVTSEEKETTKKMPVTYDTYKKEKMTVVTERVKKEGKNGKIRYRYKTAEKTYYVKDGQKTSSKAVTVDTFKKIKVNIPVYGKKKKITGMKEIDCYEKEGTETLELTEEKVKLLACTIHPFDNTVIAEAFGLELDAVYGKFGATYQEVIGNMAKALKMSLYGSSKKGADVSLTDKELLDFIARQKCSETRKGILRTAFSLIGKVPYFWGGKSAPGWNDEWNTPKLVTAAGSSSTGTIRPYGLDCSGFTAWTYETALGVDIGAGTSGQYPKTTAVKKEDLLPGDLGFKSNGGGGWSHVLMFAGYDVDGTGRWVHCTSGTGVVLNTPSYADSLVLRRPKDVDYQAAVPKDSAYGTPLYTIEVDVTHYCNCAKCNGKWAGGNTASGKIPAVGMVAMSSHYPFGTQIMIGGTMYTVEDRGGTGIENDIHRVDIFVPNHEMALRLGRFKTTAQIYRLGR